MYYFIISLFHNFFVNALCTFVSLETIDRDFLFPCKNFNFSDVEENHSWETLKVGSM